MSENLFLKNNFTPGIGVDRETFSTPVPDGINVEALRMSSVGGFIDKSVVKAVVTDAIVVVIAVINCFVVVTIVVVRSVVDVDAVVIIPKMTVIEHIARSLPYTSKAS